MVLFLQQNPIVVELGKQPEPAPDITINIYLEMFAMTGVFLLVAVLGSAMVAVGIILYKRWRDASAPPTGPSHTHTSLRI